jgi:hypothetical protein
MTCPRCQKENPGDAVFCQECGTRLETGCASCGTANQLSAKFCKKCGHRLSGHQAAPAMLGPRFGPPESYTPKHLAEKILTSKSALEGERKQVTVLFADLKGSMELLADRDPEEARKLLDPVLEHMMEAVHRWGIATWRAVAPPGGWSYCHSHPARETRSSDVSLADAIAYEWGRRPQRRPGRLIAPDRGRVEDPRVRGLRVSRSAPSTRREVQIGRSDERSEAARVHGQGRHRYGRCLDDGHGFDRR